LEPKDTKKPDIKDSHVEGLYRYAKITFDCGQYEKCATYLRDFRLLSKDEEKKFWALWGILSADILCVNVEEAFKSVMTLKDSIETRTQTDQMMQLQQRTWLLHWSLFILFNIKNDKDNGAMIDFFLQDKYLNTIQTSAPHLLRYVTIAIVIHRISDSKEKELLIRVLKQERDVYSDPFTEFILLLFLEFDFDKVKEKLALCAQILKNDIFLSNVASQFLECARLLVFETYCKIHHTINIDTLAGILDIKQDIEQHLVELIRQARVNGKLDSSKNQLLITPKVTSVYQQVIGSTKILSYRSTQLISNIDKFNKQNGEL